MYQKKDPKGTGIIARTQFSQKNIKMTTLMEFFNNMDKYALDKNILESKIISRYENGEVKEMYQRFKMPLMSQREALLTFQTIELTGEYEGKKLWLMKSVDHPDFPVKKDIIRMNLSKACILYEEDGNSMGEEISTFDMGGYFPMRLLNMAIGAMIKEGQQKNYEKMVALQKEMESTGSDTV